MANRPVKQTRTAAAKAKPRVTRSNHAGWIALLVAASACMFVLGVLVGRNSSPVNFNMETLDNLEPSVLAADAGKPEIEAEPMPEDIPFEFYDELRKKSEIDEYAEGRPRVLKPKYEKPEPSEIRMARAESRSSSTAPAVKTRESSKPETVSRQPAPTAESREPERAQAPAETRTPETTNPADRLFAIQVASLRDPEKAETLRRKFRAKGYPAFTQVATVAGKGQWCRVRIGPYAERSQAENDLARLHKAGVDAMLFRTDPSP